jgi:hypothetical protein
MLSGTSSPKRLAFSGIDFPARNINYRVHEGISVSIRPVWKTLGVPIFMCPENAFFYG